MICGLIFVFDSEGSNLTPAHHYGDFRFKTYAPIAFRYFREMFGIRPDDYMVFLCAQHSLKCAKKNPKNIKILQNEIWLWTGSD